jgi:hypothetical protein
MSLSLKIFLESTNQYKVMKFMQDMGVSEAIQVIREKTQVGGPDFGLFQPSTNAEETTTARWLKENRTLQFYGLENGVSFFLLCYTK